MSILNRKIKVIFWMAQIFISSCNFGDSESKSDKSANSTYTREKKRIDYSSLKIEKEIDDSIQYLNKGDYIRVLSCTEKYDFDYNRYFELKLKNVSKYKIGSLELNFSFHEISRQQLIHCCYYPVILKISFNPNQIINRVRVYIASDIKIEKHDLINHCICSAAFKAVSVSSVILQGGIKKSNYDK